MQIQIQYTNTNTNTIYVLLNLARINADCFGEGV